MRKPNDRMYDESLNEWLLKGSDWVLLVQQKTRTEKVYSDVQNNSEVSTSLIEICPSVPVS